MGVGVGDGVGVLGSEGDRQTTGEMGRSDKQKREREIERGGDKETEGEKGEGENALRQTKGEMGRRDKQKRERER